MLGFATAERYTKRRLTFNLKDAKCGIQFHSFYCIIRQYGIISVDVLYQWRYALRYAGMGVVGLDFFLADSKRQAVYLYVCH